MSDATCNDCVKAKATTMVGFCGDPRVEGSRSSATYLCDECTQRVMDRYKIMGKPGQMVIMPISASAKAWHDEANGERS